MNIFPSITPSLGSLEQYIRTVNQFPILSPEEEKYYSKQYKESGNLKAAESLVLSHMRVVVSVARGYAGYGLPQEDLIQEGNIGLMKAVKGFNPDTEVRLVSYALHWIRSAIQEYVIKNWRLVKIATTKAQRKLFFNLRSLKKDLAPLKSDQIKDIAIQLNVSESEVIGMDMRLYAGPEVAIDNRDVDEYETPMYYLSAESDHEPQNIFEKSQLSGNNSVDFHEALDKLDERSRYIIESRWLNEGNEKTLHELAAELNVSAERIRQIEKSAMNKMKNSLS